MKIHKLIVLFLVLAGLMAGRAQAAAITWVTGNIAAPTDVITNGTLVVAYDLGNGAGVTTVNGVNFTQTTSAPGLTSTDFNFPRLYNAYLNLPNGGASGTLNASYPGYGTLLNSGTYATGAGNDNMTLTLNSLALNHTYQLQLWVNDSRHNLSGITESVTDVASGSAVTLNFNASETVNGLGQFAVGTFVADFTSRVFTFQGLNVTANEAQLNAYQLRDLGEIVPEPSTVLLLGLGGLLVYRRRK